MGLLNIGVAGPEILTTFYVISWPKLGVQPDSLVSPPDLVTAYLRDKAAVPCPCSLLVVREAIELVGGFEESFRDQYEDQVFYAKICLNAPVFVTGHCWDRYRQVSAAF